MTKTTLCFTLTCCLYFLTQTAMAEQDWRCTAHDRENLHWLAQSGWERSSRNMALDLCKKNSKYPGSCIAETDNCELFVNGLTTRPMWRCLALDIMAKPWPSSEISQHRDHAALSAKAHCERKSGYPDTCYVNLMTCKNINERD